MLFAFFQTEKIDMEQFQIWTKSFHKIVQTIFVNRCVLDSIVKPFLFQVCFDLFDTKKVEFLSADDLGEIMRAMGFRPTEEELKELLAEIDEDGSGEIEFGEFSQLCATFLVEDPDMETMKRELKDAFRYNIFFALVNYY